MNNFTASQHYALHVTSSIHRFSFTQQNVVEETYQNNGFLQDGEVRRWRKVYFSLTSSTNCRLKWQMKWQKKLWIIQCSSTFAVCGLNPRLPPFTVCRFYPPKKSYNVATQMKPLRSTFRRYYLLPHVYQNAPATLTFLPPVNVWKKATKMDD